MDTEVSLIADLQARVRELEDKVEALRLSRRVLMNLLDLLEREKTEELSKLALQNEKLLRNNSRYARKLIHYTTRITELERQVQNNFHRPT